MSVHNHSPREGEGLECPEFRLPNGSVMGRCLVIEALMAGKITPNDLRKGAGMTVRSEGIHNPGTDMTPDNYQLRAIELVKNEIDSHYPPGKAPVYELKICWFSKVLQNWKALVATDMLDGAYYELTYNGDKQETYIDVYGKRVNIVVPD